MRTNGRFNSFETFETSKLNHYQQLTCPMSIQSKVAHQWSLNVMKMIRPHFLSPYSQGRIGDKAVRVINGNKYAVERFNHGLAHGLRQAALAKNIFNLVLNIDKIAPHHHDVDLLKMHIWAKSKSVDCHFIKKLEMTSAFQRSGRQSEASSASDLALYKMYELQDAVNFKNAARNLPFFINSSEIQVFEEAILWSNNGNIDENENDDLKYLRRILHCAHTFDLRRIRSFDGKRVQQDGINQLLGKTVELGPESPYEKISAFIWNRSGAYLKATGDRDLVDGRSLQNRFFVQTKYPHKIVDAIYDADS